MSETICTNCDRAECDVAAAHAVTVSATIKVTPGENGCDCNGTFSRSHNPSRGCPVHSGESYVKTLEAAWNAEHDARNECHANAVDWRERAVSLRADRDRLAAEVERLKSDVAMWADLAADNLKLYDQRSDEVTTLRAERDDAIAARDSAVNDTAEAIARWLEEFADAESAGRFMTPTSEQTRILEHRALALLAAVDEIRAGAWRGQNGGE